MTVKLKSLAIDLDKATDGDWVPYLPWKGVRFKVRSNEYPPFRAAQEKLARELAKKRQTTGEDVPTEEIQSRFAEAVAEHLLLGWEGFDEGYSSDAAYATLTDPAYRDVLRAVEECANRVGRSEIEFVESEAKN